MTSFVHSMPGHGLGPKSGAVILPNRALRQAPATLSSAVLPPTVLRARGSLLPLITSKRERLPHLWMTPSLPRCRCAPPSSSASAGPAAETTTLDAEPSEQGAAKEDPSGMLLGVENEQMREVVMRSGLEKDKPKFVAYDYGFQASFLRDTPTVPGGAMLLAVENFKREYVALRRNYLFTKLRAARDDKEERGAVGLFWAYVGRGIVYTVRALDNFLVLYDGLPEIKPEAAATGEADELRVRLRQLTLSNSAVWDRENARPPIVAPKWVMAQYYFLCWVLDFVFDRRPIQRFWFLETVARMPYFSYISMLHLYETLGWWRIGGDVRKVHFAEEWNEMHHLKIMESLGGDGLWIDRFIAQHAAFFYYWVLCAMFALSPKVAYNFSELIESHAVDTYGTFAEENKELLKTLPPSPPAIAYYYGEDLYMFDEFQTSRAPESRRPVINNLYDVFVAISDDEVEHVRTMAACQQMGRNVVSPNRLKHTKEEHRTE